MVDVNKNESLKEACASPGEESIRYFLFSLLQPFALRPLRTCACMRTGLAGLDFLQEWLPNNARRMISHSHAYSSNTTV